MKEYTSEFSDRRRSIVDFVNILAQDVNVAIKHFPIMINRVSGSANFDFSQRI